MPPAKVTQSYLQATGVAEDIASMEAKAVSALAPAMAIAQKELAADLAVWVGKLGANAADLKYTAAHIRQLQLLLGIAEAKVQTTKAGYPHASFPMVAAAAVKNVMGQAQPQKLAAQTLEGQLEHLRGKFADMPAPQLIHAALLAKGDKLVLSKFANSAARYAGQVNQDLKLQFGVGLAKGETVQQLTKRIAGLANFQKAVDANHPTAAGAAMAGGLTKRYQFWAQRLVRTELNNAYNYSAQEGIKMAHQLDDRIVQMWDATLDNRVCVDCRAMHGKTAKPGKTFPGGFWRPPMHPNCRCGVVSWMDEWASDEAQNVISAEELAAREAQLQKQQDEIARREKAAQANKAVAAEDLDAYDKHKQAQAAAATKAKAAAEAALAAKKEAEYQAKLQAEAAAAAKAKALADKAALEAQIAAEKAKAAALAAEQAKLQAEVAAAKQAQQDALVKAQLEAAAQAKKDAAKAKATQKKQDKAAAALAQAPKPAPFDPATSPKLNLSFQKKGVGSAKLLSQEGFVQTDKNTISGHGYTFKWVPEYGWSATSSAGGKHPGMTHVYNWGTNTWQTNKEAVAAAQEAQQKMAKFPNPNLPPVQPAAAPVPTPPVVTKTHLITESVIVPFEPDAIMGYTWKPKDGGWALYKGDTEAVKQVPAGPWKIQDGQLGDTYALGGDLAKKGFVAVAPGKMQGYGVMYAKNPTSGVWHKLDDSGKPAAAPAPTPYVSSSFASKTPTPAPTGWKPEPIKLDPKRKGVTNFDAHPSAEYAGFHGRAFTQDGDVVEGGSMRVIKVKDASGDEYYETSFKVTHPYGVAAQGYGSGTASQWGFRQRTVKAGVMHDNGHEHAENCKTRIHAGENHTVEIGTSGAATNLVRIRAKSLQGVNAALDKFSEHVGADLRKPPAKEDLILQAKARLAAKFDPVGYGERMRKTAGATADGQKQIINEMFDELSKKHPAIAKAMKDAKEVEVYPGHKTLYSKSLGEHVAKTFPAMYHDGSPPPEIAALISSNSGLMSSMKRFNSGVFTTGMSTSTDFETGGADGVFMRLSKTDPVTTSGKYRWVIDTKEVMGRMDWWAFNHDNFGRSSYQEAENRFPLPKMTAKSTHLSSSNEVMAPHGVPPTAFKEVMCRTEATRQELLEVFKKQGITQINGKPVEEFVVTDRIVSRSTTY